MDLDKVMEALNAKRDELGVRMKPKGDSFSVVLLGGAWTKQTKGVAHDSVMGTPKRGRWPTGAPSTGSTSLPGTRSTLLEMGQPAPWHRPGAAACSTDGASRRNSPTLTSGSRAKTVPPG